MRHLARILMSAVFILAGVPVLVGSTGAATRLVEFHDRLLAQQQNEPVVPTGRSINLTEEHRHIIREIVLKDMKVQNAGDVTVSIGGPVPSGVTAQGFPTEISQKIPPLKSHTFFVTGDQIVVVDPKDNTVADIVK